MVEHQRCLTSPGEQEPAVSSSRISASLTRFEAESPMSARRRVSHMSLSSPRQDLPNSNQTRTKLMLRDQLPQLAKSHGPKSSPSCSISSISQTGKNVNDHVNLLTAPQNNMSSCSISATYLDNVSQPPVIPERAHGHRSMMTGHLHPHVVMQQTGRGKCISRTTSVCDLPLMEEDEAPVIGASAAGSSLLLQKTLPLQGTEEAGKNRNESPSRLSFCVMSKQRYKLGRRGGSLANLMHLLKTNTGDLSVEEYHASRPVRRGSTLGLGSSFGGTAAVSPAVVSPATSSHNSSNNNVTDEVSAGGSTAGTAVGSDIKSTTAPYGKVVSRQLLIPTATSQDVCKGSQQHVNRKGNLLARQPGALEQADMMESRVHGDMTCSSGSTAEGVIMRGAAPSSEPWSPGITRPYVAENVPPLSPNKSTSVYQNTGGSSTIAMRRTWLEEALADESSMISSSSSSQQHIRSAPRRGVSSSSLSLSVFKHNASSHHL